MTNEPLAPSRNARSLARVNREPGRGTIFGVVSLLKKPFYPRDVDYAVHQAFGLRRPYLLNALVPMAVPLIRRAVGF